MAANPTIQSRAADLAAGRTTSRKLTEEALARIDDAKGEGKRAFIKVWHAQALAAADASDLQRKGYVARTIGIKLRYDDFKIATRDQAAGFYTADAVAIRRLAGQCLKRVPLERRLRLLGVRASALAKAGEERIYESNQPPAQAVRSQSATESIAMDQLF